MVSSAGLSPNLVPGNRYRYRRHSMFHLHEQRLHDLVPDPRGHQGLRQGQSWGGVSHFPFVDESRTHRRQHQLVRKELKRRLKKRSGGKKTVAYQSDNTQYTHSCRNELAHRDISNCGQLVRIGGIVGGRFSGNLFVLIEYLETHVIRTYNKSEPAVVEPRR